MSRPSFSLEAKQDQHPPEKVSRPSRASLASIITMISIALSPCSPCTDKYSLSLPHLHPSASWKPQTAPPARYTMIIPPSRTSHKTSLPDAWSHPLTAPDVHSFRSPFSCACSLPACPSLEHHSWFLSAFLSASTSRDRFTSDYAKWTWYFQFLGEEPTLWSTQTYKYIAKTGLHRFHSSTAARILKEKEWPKCSCQVSRQQCDRAVVLVYVSRDALLLRSSRWRGFGVFVSGIVE